MKNGNVFGDSFNATYYRIFNQTSGHFETPFSLKMSILYTEVDKNGMPFSSARYKPIFHSFLVGKGNAALELGIEGATYSIDDAICIAEIFAKENKRNEYIVKEFFIKQTVRTSFSAKVVEQIVTEHFEAP